MMKLEDVKNLRNMVDYAEGLANDISLGIASVDGKCDAELIADLVVHCMDLAEDETKRKFINRWISLSDKPPELLHPWESENCVNSVPLLVKTKDGQTYEAKAYKFNNDTIDFFTTRGLHKLQNVVEWREKVINYSE